MVLVLPQEGKKMAKKQTKSVEIEQPIETQISYTKTQIYNSKRYMNKKDIVTVMLKDDEKYTFDQVDKLIEQFLKGGK